MSYNNKLFKIFQKNNANNDSDKPSRVNNVKLLTANNLPTIRKTTIPDYNKVPLKIFQTWYTKKLPKDMEKAVNNIKKTNPEFEHYLFDDEDCHTFIKNNYSKDILDAFEKLIPGAYKADLWRYCVLYFMEVYILTLNFYVKMILNL